MAEVATGLALLVSPPIVVRLLFDAEVAGAGIVVSRLAGIGLLALGLACLPGRDRSDRALGAMLGYSFLAALYLAYLGAGAGSAGLLLWPAVGFHAVMTALLARAWFTRGD